MTVVFIALYYWVEYSKVVVRSPDYQLKIAAARNMESALETLQEVRFPGTGEFGSSGIDKLTHTMLGEKYSPITTDEGSVDDKLTVLNPNFAAVVVDMMNQAGLVKGDTIAVFFTGSLPGANVAVFAAAKALQLHPVVITSVGSSWWGANRPDFTWLDMERVLYETGVFKYRSIAATVGGKDDLGGLRLSDQGRAMIAEAINRNGVTFINEGSLSANIKGRLKMLERQAPLSAYKVAINVGGGVATVGLPQNAQLIPSGFNRHLPRRNYPNPGSLIHYLDDVGVPIINIADVTQIARDYNLRIPPDPARKIGEGLVYKHQQYNLPLAIIALVLMFLILGIVKYFDHQRYKWREEKVDSEEEI